MNVYRLEVIHHILQDYTREYDFLAADDNEARSMVEVFYKVCHPLSHGPLWRVGKEETRDGIKAVYLDEKFKMIVPLEVAKLDELPEPFTPLIRGPK